MAAEVVGAPVGRVEHGAGGARAIGTLAAVAAPATPEPGAPGAGSEPDPGNDAVVICRGLTKAYGATTALAGLDLDVRRGELLALLGPSGCGKTTTLRIIAGFDRPDRGQVLLGGEEVAGPRRFVAPERRRIGVVFQDYALFPHLDVAANVGYGLRDRSTRRARVAEMLELVGLGSMARRRPHELSGGEQQRVAIARALAPDPRIVLLDEPFSNLDAALRLQVRAEVADILTAAGATAVFVTHDQEEALSLADRVAVVHEGRVLQVGAPQELYAAPAERFVATFVGDADVVPGTSDGFRLVTQLGFHTATRPLGAGPVDVVVRPEQIRLRLDGFGPGTVRRTSYFGHDQLIEVALREGGGRIRARTGPGVRFLEGDRVGVVVNGPVVAFPRAAPDSD